MKQRTSKSRGNQSASQVISQINIDYRPLAVLHPDPRNARVHSARQLNLLAKSIQAFGFVVPIIIDKEDRIICGHARAAVAEKQGISEVPVICLEHLSQVQLKAFMLADNRLTELAAWDERLLGETLKELTVVDLEFDIEATGFTTGEIDLRIEGIEAVDKDPADDPIDFDGPAVSVERDCWKLGPHRLICGSALDIQVYGQLMNNKRASLIFTDPPYNVPVNGHVGGNGHVKHREFVMGVGEMSSTTFTQFLTSVFQLMSLHGTNGAIHFVCMDWRHLPEVLAAGQAVYSEIKNLCIWAKDRAGMGSLYRSQHELVLVFKQGTKPHINNIELGRFGRHRSNVWNYPSILSDRHTEEGDMLALHPTVKPVQMVADAILDCSRRGDIVLDPFLGSGTTLLAAQRVGRVCYGIEIDPLYIDTAIQRWQRFTGENAINEATGETFTQRKSHLVVQQSAGRRKGSRKAVHHD